MALSRQHNSRLFYTASTTADQRPLEATDYLRQQVRLAGKQPIAAHCSAKLHLIRTALALCYF